MEYDVVSDADEIDEQFGTLSPFNLSKDYKKQGLDEKTVNRIAKDIGQELIYGPHGNTYIVKYKCSSNNNINYSKIKLDDKEKKQGKSKGYRVYLLVDTCNHRAYFLHIYKHGKGEDADISHREKNMLRNLVDEYNKALENY